MEMGGEANVFGSCLYFPASPLVTEKPLENRLLAGCHASWDYELYKDSDGFHIFIVIVL